VYELYKFTTFLRTGQPTEVGKNKTHATMAGKQCVTVMTGLVYQKATRPTKVGTGDQEISNQFSWISLSSLSPNIME
jgi:hypothetical protein